MGDVTVFGKMPDGTEVHEITISAGDLTAKIITLGAVIRDVRLKGVDHPVVLGFDDLDSYVNHKAYFGAVVGRCANRIAGGKLPLDGKVYDLVVKDGDLVAATHGRSFWVLDDLTPLRQLTEQIAGETAYLFPPRPTVRRFALRRAASRRFPPALRDRTAG